MAPVYPSSHRRPGYTARLTRNGLDWFWNFSWRLEAQGHFLRWFKHRPGCKEDPEGRSPESFLLSSLHLLCFPLSLPPTRISSLSHNIYLYLQPSKQQGHIFFLIFNIWDCFSPYTFQNTAPLETFQWTRYNKKIIMICPKDFQKRM